MWKTKIQNGEGVDSLIALKQIRKEAFADEAEMKRSKEFYEFLKNFPGFGKFVPDTLYFKARVTKDSEPQAFCVQQYIEGERIDRISDDELYKDQEVVRQLLEFINSSIELLKTVQKDGSPMPDFMRTPEKANTRVTLGGLALHPRYSGNIFLADKPDENGQRIFFVDTGMNADIRTKKNWQLASKYIIAPLETAQLKSWKSKLEKIATQNN